MQDNFDKSEPLIECMLYLKISSRVVLTISAALCGLLPFSLEAKPLLKSSELDAVALCERDEGTNKEIIEVCNQALVVQGLSESQRNRLMYNLSQALDRDDRNNEAEALLKKLLAEAPDYAPALRGLGWLHHERYEFGAAAEQFQRSLDTEVSASALAGLGAAGYKAGKISLEDAIVYLDSALAISPKYSWVMREKGWLLQRENRWEDSLAPFRQAIDLYADDENAHAGLASALYELGRYKEALEHINAAIAQQPDDAQNLLWRAHIMRGLGRYRQAIVDAAKAVALDSKEGDALVALARAQYAAGERLSAFATLRKGRETMPDDEFITYWLAELLHSDWQLDEAWQVVSELVTMPDPDGYDFKLQAEIALDRNEIRQARKAIDQALKVAPWIEYSYYVDALVMLKEDRVSDAVARFGEAIERGLPPSRVGDMAAALIKEGHYVQAIALRWNYSNSD